MLTQAMSRRTVVAPISAPVIVRSSPPTTVLANRRANPARTPRESAYRQHARGQLGVGPFERLGQRRRPRIDTPRDAAPDVPSAGAIAIHSSLELGNLNLGGMTPTIVYGTSSSRMTRPSAAVSA